MIIKMIADFQNHDPHIFEWDFLFLHFVGEEREDKLREEALGGISTPQSFTFLLLLQFANLLDFLQTFTNVIF